MSGVDVAPLARAILGRLPVPRHATFNRFFDGEGGVPDLIDAALKTDPNFAEARAYRSGLLLALEDFPAARAEAEKALVSNPSSAAALAALAALVPTTRTISLAREE